MLKKEFFCGEVKKSGVHLILMQSMTEMILCDILPNIIQESNEPHHNKMLVQEEKV
ncbi:MAG: hypothetical protein ACJ71D_05010 [Nitrososphaera sp.]